MSRSSSIDGNAAKSFNILATSLSPTFVQIKLFSDLYFIQTVFSVKMSCTINANDAIKFKCDFQNKSLNINYD